VPEPSGIIEGGVMKGLLAAVLVVLVGAARSSRAQFDPPPDPEAAPILAKLQEQADHVMPAGVSVLVRFRDLHVFEYAVDIKSPEVVGRIRKELASDEKDEWTLLNRWSTNLDEKLVGLTAGAVRDAGKDPLFNPETDICVEIDGAAMQSAEGQPPAWFFASFRGTRNPGYRDEAGKVLVAANKPACGGEISVRIEPDKAVWEPRETIQGKITITNTGKTRVALSRRFIDDVTIIDDHGRSPKRFRPMGFIDFDMHAVMTEFLAPGQVHSGRFAIYTDRMHTMADGSYVAEGRWRLTYQGADQYNVRATCQDTPVEVRAPKGGYFGPRICSAAVAGNNVVLRREHAIIEVIDPTNGVSRGARIPKGLPPDGWDFRPPAFTDDGRVVQLFQGDANPPSLVSIFGAAPGFKPLIAPPGLEIGPAGFAVYAFSPDGKQAYGATNFYWVILDVATGREAKRLKSPEQWPSLAPDASFVAWVDGGLARLVGDRGEDRVTVHVAAFDRPDQERVVPIEGHGNALSHKMGLGGVYLSDEFSNSVTYVPYADGPTRQFATGAPADLVGETVDGSISAFAWPGWRDFEDKDYGPTTVSVYRVADGAKLCEIPQSSESKVLLLSNPPRVLCFSVKRPDDGFFGSEPWLLEKCRVYDAESGKLKQELDLTPGPNTLPRVQPDLDE
jgi:hypothetical protein